ncbi:MAG: AGE family epimerase/isomerase [Rhizobium sp.]|nr:AGE family epimerase/isomerase [Rhizobium sp.]
MGQGKRGGYTRSFNRHTERVTDPVRDLYDNACVLLALSWLLTATGKDVYRHQIEQTILAVDRTLTDPFGGWAEDSDGTLPRRQKPAYALPRSDSWPSRREQTDP